VTMAHKPVGHHHFHADLVGKEIVVTDQEGHLVEVSFGGTSDRRTVYACVDGVGFIGGWSYPHRKTPFRHLVERINEGKTYQQLADLPRSYRH